MVTVSGLRRWELSDTGLELAKWLALLCMVIDHVNAVFFDHGLGLTAEVLGRVAFPVFAIVLGYNLARPGVDHVRLLGRLAIVGVIATPAYAYLFGVWPANVLFTFAAAVVLVALGDRGKFAAAAIMVGIAGFFVDYLHAGVMLTFAAYAIRSGFRPGWALLGLSLAALCCLNGNLWALLSLPLLWGLGQVRAPFPRLRWAFWAAYPAHLYVLAIIAAGVGAAHG